MALLKKNDLRLMMSASTFRNQEQKSKLMHGKQKRRNFLKIKAEISDIRKKID